MSCFLLKELCSAIKITDNYKSNKTEIQSKKY